MLFSAETWALKKKEEKLLERIEMRILRWFAGVCTVGVIKGSLHRWGNLNRETEITEGGRSSKQKIIPSTNSRKVKKRDMEAEMK